MGKLELSGRNNWEKISGKKASNAEQDLYEVFRNEFKDTEYILHEKPKHLKNLYATVKLDKEVKKEIYNPDIDLGTARWGVSPDFAIENIRTRKNIIW